MDPDWTALGQRVKRRREQMRLGQSDLIARGGPSDFTLRKIEHGEPGPYRPQTFTQLETALGWPVGTADLILNGDATEEQLEQIEAVVDRPIRDLSGKRFAGAAGRRGRFFEVPSDSGTVDAYPLATELDIIRALTEIGGGSLEAVDTALRAACEGFQRGTVSWVSVMTIMAAIDALATLSRRPSTPTIAKARMALIEVLEAELLPNSGLRLDDRLDGLLVRVLNLCDADRRRLLEMLSRHVEAGV